MSFDAHDLDLNELIICRNWICATNLFHICIDINSCFINTGVRVIDSARNISHTILCIVICQYVFTERQINLCCS